MTAVARKPMLKRAMLKEALRTALEANETVCSALVPMVAQAARATGLDLAAAVDVAVNQPEAAGFIERESARRQLIDDFDAM